MKDGNLYNQIAIEIMKINNINIIDNREFTKMLIVNKKPEDIYADNIHFKEYVQIEQAKYFSNQIQLHFRRLDA